MAQILLEKLEKLKKFEKETMTKYELIDSPEPGKLQFTPFVRTPLMFEFKLDYELSEDGRERMLASPQLLEYGQTAFQCFESACRPRSAASLQLPRKKHSDVPGVRPFSAPFSEKGNLQALDNGFMILKLKPPNSREVKKRQKWMLKDTSKILRHTNDFTTEMSGRHGEATVTVGKGDKLNQATIYEEPGKRDAEHLGRSDSLPKIDLSKLVKKTILSCDSDVKEKKLFVPLCIEDEIEKPNAKVIRVDDEREKLSSTTTASESFPIYCSHEGYIQKYVLNRWLALYGDKAFYDTSKKAEVCVRLNSVLQNNINESISILRSQKHTLPSVTTKRKKKPTFPKKQPITGIQMSSFERFSLPPHCQKKKPFLQKLSESFPNTIRRHTAIQRNITQTIPKCRKDIFMVHGMNPTTDTHHDISTSSLIKRIKSQFPGCLMKPVGKCTKRGRLVHVDYIPISQPISIHTSESEVSGHHTSHSVHHPSANSTSIEKDKPEPYLHLRDKKCSLHEGRLGGIEFAVSCYSTFVTGPSRRTSVLSPRSILSESSGGTRPPSTEEQEAPLPHGTVISIPTAQYYASESRRNSNRQGTTGT